MVNLVRKHWPLIAAVAVLWAIIALLLILSIRQNQGHLVYALDDPYIHMAMAKNFAEHGVWGINKEGFSSSSSSPLWTLLLSLNYFLFGSNEVSPFVLNLAFGALLIFFVYFVFKKYKIRPLFIFFALLAFIFLTPIPRLTFFGQEHVMHALITVLFVYFSAKILSDEKSTDKKLMTLTILAPLVTMARYEGLFLILVVSILLILRRRLFHSLCVGAMGALPIVIYGAISISKGWYFLPNPVLLKGKVPNISTVSSLSGIVKFLDFSVTNAFHQMRSYLPMLFFILAALILFIFQYGKQNNKQKGRPKEVRMMLIIFVASAFLHMQFAKIGWFFRYEAYLVSLGLFVIISGMHEYLSTQVSRVIQRRLIPRYLAQAFVIFIIILPFNTRAIGTLKTTPRATTNIYEQQYQMGIFLREFYQGKAVAANDIGAINYLADIECVDLYGLANLESATLMKERRYDFWNIYNLAKYNDVKIAIVYDHWYKRFGGLPPQWSKVGQWRISKNVVCGSGVRGGETVSFYAVDPLEKDKLIRNLQYFASRLPKGVVQLGEYTMK